MRFGIRLFCCAGMILLSLSGVKYAQAKPDILADEQDGYAVMLDFSKCMVKTKKNFVVPLLRTRPFSPEEYTTTAQIAAAGRFCQTGAAKLSFQPYLLRGAVSYELYIREFGGAKLASPEPKPFKAWWVVSEGASVDGADRGFLLHSFAWCVSTRSPVLARAFVMTTMGGDAEAKALANLNPALGPCYPVGGKARFNRTSLRALLSEALLRSGREAKGEPVDTFL